MGQDGLQQLYHKCQSLTGAHQRWERWARSGCLGKWYFHFPPKHIHQSHPDQSHSNSHSLFALSLWAGKAYVMHNLGAWYPLVVINTWLTSSLCSNLISLLINRAFSPKKNMEIFANLIGNIFDRRFVKCVYWFHNVFATLFLNLRAPLRMPWFDFEIGSAARSLEIGKQAFTQKNVERLLAFNSCQ